tara:strand:- start:17436 stop:18035 length:600 start_codon:yes stop_codon:yes gene_type:complete
MGNFLSDFQDNIDRMQSDGWQWLGLDRGTADGLSQSDYRYDESAFQVEAAVGLARLQYLLNGDMRGMLTAQQVQQYNFQREQFLDNLDNEDDVWERVGPGIEDFQPNSFNNELSNMGKMDTGEEEEENQNIFQAISPNLQDYSANVDNFGKEIENLRESEAPVGQEPTNQMQGVAVFDSFVENMLATSLGFNQAGQTSV